MDVVTAQLGRLRRAPADRPLSRQQTAARDQAIDVLLGVAPATGRQELLRRAETRPVTG